MKYQLDDIDSDDEDFFNNDMENVNEEIHVASV